MHPSLARGFQFAERTARHIAVETGHGSSTKRRTWEAGTLFVHVPGQPEPCHKVNPPDLTKSTYLEPKSPWREVLNVLDFSSERQRMSIIVRQGRGVEHSFPLQSQAVCSWSTSVPVETRHILLPGLERVIIFVCT